MLVHAAKDIQDVEYFGTQDPFAQVTLLPRGKDGDERMARTRAHDDGDTSPVWGEDLQNHMSFVIGSKASKPERVLVEVYNENTMSHDLIGSTEVALPLPWSKHMKGNTVDGWHALDSGGEIRVSVYFEVSKFKAELIVRAPLSCPLPPSP